MVRHLSFSIERCGVETLLCNYFSLGRRAHGSTISYVYCSYEASMYRFIIKIKMPKNHRYRCES